MKRWGLACFATLILSLPCAGVVRAQEQQGDDAHEAHENHVALFLGGTTKIADTDRPKTAFAVGAEYVRTLGEFFGIGLAVDYAAGDFERDLLIVVPLVATPIPAWKLIVAPGIEIGEEIELDPEAAGSGDGPEIETKTKGFFAIRFGTAYDFTVGRSFTLSPALYYDVIGSSKNTWVYGFNFGYVF